MTENKKKKQQHLIGFDVKPVDPRTGFLSAQKISQINAALHQDKVEFERRKPFLAKRVSPQMHEIKSGKTFVRQEKIPANLTNLRAVHHARNTGDEILTHAKHPRKRKEIINHYRRLSDQNSFSSQPVTFLNHDSNSSFRNKFQQPNFNLHLKNFGAQGLPTNNFSHSVGFNQINPINQVFSPDNFKPSESTRVDIDERRYLPNQPNYLFDDNEENDVSAYNHDSEEEYGDNDEGEFENDSSGEEEFYPGEEPENHPETVETDFEALRNAANKEKGRSVEDGKKTPTRSTFEIVSAKQKHYLQGKKFKSPLEARKQAEILKQQQQEEIQHYRQNLKTQQAQKVSQFQKAGTRKIEDFSKLNPVIKLQNYPENLKKPEFNQIAHENFAQPYQVARNVSNINNKLTEDNFSQSENSAFNFEPSKTASDNFPGEFSNVSIPKEIKKEENELEFSRLNAKASRPISFNYRQLETLNSLPEGSFDNNKNLANQEIPLEQGRKVHQFFGEKKIKEENDDGILASYNQFKKDGAGFFRRILQPSLSYAGFAAASLTIVFGVVFGFYAADFKDKVQVKGVMVASNLTGAKEALAKKDFGAAFENFSEASKNLNQVQSEIEKMGGDMADIFKDLPYLSKISSGKNLVTAADELTLAAKEFSQILADLSSLNSPLASSNENQKGGKTILELLLSHQDSIKNARNSLNRANVALESVKADDLPEKYRQSFIKIKEMLPGFSKIVGDIDDNQQIFLELLGQNGPRKYLFVFQNNQEMRATGGFIGSYALVSVNNGQIKNLFVDGIFNPDWQLKTDVIPPNPIQKISAGWSTHDANWFPDFPLSAKKIAWFYEKTGGPTVDGVIALTPNLLEELLKITGPIEMPDYNETITAENFIEKTQHQVEEKFDKEKNQPKEILADLAPIILNRLFSVKDPSRVAQVFGAASKMLHQGHILFYSADKKVQSVISAQGWGGEVLASDKDYLMVINSNINGFKTDGVIDEEIYHTAEVQADGSVIDTVRIKRIHNGGDMAYDWWNKVNSNYMRVYVPLGSKLLDAKGYTRETVSAPLDYEKLGFKKDPDIARQEAETKTDEKTGTRIYDESGKTVFGNWVYVSPKESVEIEYQYLLPFKIDLEKREEKFDSYSLLVQKQAGSKGSKFISNFNFTDLVGSKVTWQYPNDLKNLDGSSIYYSDVLLTNKFLAVILRR